LPQKKKTVNDDFKKRNRREIAASNRRKLFFYFWLMGIVSSGRCVYHHTHGKRVTRAETTQPSETGATGDRQMATATKTKLTSRFQTIAIVGFSAGVSRDQNPAAHGGVCLLQARIGTNGQFGRKVNTNGRHKEIGEAFALDHDTLRHWQAIAAASR
jgi:hypothetical protein